MCLCWMRLKVFERSFQCPLMSFTMSGGSACVVTGQWYAMKPYVWYHDIGNPIWISLDNQKKSTAPRCLEDTVSTRSRSWVPICMTGIWKVATGNRRWCSQVNNFKGSTLFISINLTSLCMSLWLTMLFWPDVFSKRILSFPSLWTWGRNCTSAGDSLVSMWDFVSWTWQRFNILLLLWCLPFTQSAQFKLICGGSLADVRV